MAHIYFFNIPYHGHINPTLPLVRELVNRGEQVTYVAGPAFEARIQATGAAYRGYRDLAAFAQSRDDNHLIHQGALVADSANRLLADVLSMVEAARPDLLMFDMSAPWGNIAGRRFGIPAIACFPHLPFYWRTVTDDRRVLRRALASLRPGHGHWRALIGQTARLIRTHNLRRPADINVLSSAAAFNIVFLTRYYQPYASHFDDSYLYIGPTVEAERREEPMVIDSRPGRKLIYIAVGTLYKASAAFFQTCMAAFDDPRYAVIMSIGRAVEPESLGPTPENFTVVQYAPQLQVLQAADLFITHGGMNSINEAVSYDAPMIVVPNTVEQAINAARIEQLQCGLYLDHSHLTAESLRASAARIFDDPMVSSGLSRLRASFEEAGGVALAADAIAQFKRKQGMATAGR